MPTITTTTTIDLPAGKALAFAVSAGVGEAVADPDGRGARFVLGPQPVYIGPWSTAVRVDVRVSSGELVYQVDDDGQQGVDVSGALTLTPSGLTKGGVALTAAEQAGVRGGLGLALLLDRPIKCSILGNSFATEMGLGWFYEFFSASGGRFEADYIGGVAGNTSAQMLARVDAIPSTSDICFVAEGSNDSSAPIASAAHIANISAICASLLARGIKPIIVLPPPKNSAVSSMAAYRYASAQLARKAGYKTIDPFGAYFDESNGNWVSGASPDGVHPSQATAVQAGRDAVSQVLGNLAFDVWAPKANVWAGQVSNNLLLTSSSGLGTGWNKFGSGVASIADAASDGVAGNWQKLTATALTGVTGMHFDISFPAGNLLTDEWLIKAYIKFNTVSGTPPVSFFLRWINAGGGGIRDDSIAYNVTIDAIPARAWQQIVVPPAGAVSAKLFAQMGETDTYSSELWIGAVAVVNLTRTAGF